MTKQETQNITKLLQSLDSNIKHLVMLGNGAYSEEEHYKLIIGHRLEQRRINKTKSPKEKEHDLEVDKIYEEHFNES